MRYISIEKRTLRYANGTCDFCNFNTSFYCAFSNDDCKSTLGYAFSFGSCIASSSSKKLRTKSLSTREVEYTTNEHVRKFGSDKYR